MSTPTSSSKPNKAYILRLSSNPISVEYAKEAAESCEKIGLTWEYFEGYDHLDIETLVKTSNLGVKEFDPKMTIGAASASFSHYKIWEKIRDNKETAIILEHDAIIFWPVDLEIIDNTIVNLGYKVNDISKYDYNTAGKPNKIINIDQHSGAHAYAINYKTAEFLLKELEEIGAKYSIDATYFLPRREEEVSKISLALVEPIAALGWVRISTIDPYATNYNYKMVESFLDNFNKKEPANKLKIAFLDNMDFRYDGDTLNETGLGGSETALINMAEELVKVGFQVFVFNNKETDSIVNGVNYHHRWNNDHQYQKFDILISLRSFLPFIPERFKFRIWEEHKFNIENTYHLVQNSNMKIVWAHDKFALGEEWMDYLIETKELNEVFVLSDYQFNLYLNRQLEKFEKFKNTFFRTRNGVKTYGEDFNMEEKDPNLFVFSSAYIKGMQPLVEKVWPLVKKEIPEAKLVIIGGTYRDINSKNNLSSQEISVLILQNKFNNFLDISFTGYIKQEEVAKIMKKATYMIYPNIYEETFGISILEAINYNVIVITNKFGALEETANEYTSYLVDGKFTEERVEIFVNKVKEAYYDQENRIIKVNNCNYFKPFISWENVALHWKIHFLRKLNIKINEEERKRNQEFLKAIMTLTNQRVFNREDLVDLLY